MNTHKPVNLFVEFAAWFVGRAGDALKATAKRKPKPRKLDTGRP